MRRAGRIRNEERIKSRMRFGHTDLNRTLLVIMIRMINDTRGDAAAPHSRRWNRFDSSVRNKTAGQETSRCQMSN